jgi:HPt (histidine-containing phosphotransfer) domain-containing protein
MTRKNDKLALLRAYLGDDTQQIREMLELFLENIPKDLKELVMFCKKNDVENIRKAAHRAKSSVKFFGFNEVGEILQKMEILSKEKATQNQLETMAKQVSLLMEHELLLLRKELALL